MTKLRRGAASAGLRTVIAAVVVVSVAGCGSGDDAPSSQTTAVPSASTPSSVSVSPTSTQADPAIVGEWQRVTTCEERVAALAQAHLERYAAEQVAGEGWVPGVSEVSQLADRRHPCRGAVPLKHSHFFTAEDRFGSRDDLGDQVDDDSYRLAGHDTVVIGGVRFRYRIAGNEVLRLFPELPACARRGCFEAQWAVAVSYNGLPWHRIG